jgi:ABC-2 type transport system ATP-binding protein
LLALGNLYAIRDLLDKHPHRIMITTDEPRKLASAFIGEDPIYGVRFPEEGKLELQTNDLSAAHSVLPRVIVDSNVSVSRIDNPDDNLESLLGYLIGGE